MEVRTTSAPSSISKLRGEEISSLNAGIPASLPQGRAPPPYTETAPAAVPFLPPNDAPPSRNTVQPLTKPIAIPAESPSPDSAFLRAYPPILEEYGIKKQDFLQYLDRLNDIKQGNPPINVLDGSTGILRFVPYSAGSEAHIENQIRELSRDVFQPKGLKMEIAKMNAMAKMTRTQSGSAEGGKVDNWSDMLQMIEDTVRSSQSSDQERSLDSLDRWVERLEFVPARKKEAGCRWSRWSSKASKMLQSDEKTANKRRKSSASSESSQTGVTDDLLLLTIRNLDSDSGDGENPYL